MSAILTADQLNAFTASTSKEQQAVYLLAQLEKEQDSFNTANPDKVLSNISITPDFANKSVQITANFPLSDSAILDSVVSSTTAFLP